MNISSPAFPHGGSIPERYSQFGRNVSPPLSFADVPGKAGSLALIVDDPDAPKGLVTHWIVFNLDPVIRSLEEGNAIKPPARQGSNTHGNAAYMGPRPPDREHRYFFRLYALDRMLAPPAGASRNQIDDALSGRVIAQAELMGRFAPPAKK
ncbi:MAG: hypothetical protein JWM88_1815 [Verrucomicrobia bacterium]|nr:hypothetical protein [Verrucomicrobiota bacterium]